MMNLPKTNNPYWAKDQAKAARANRFIGIGAPGSSTDVYRKGLLLEQVNRRSYSPDDIVFVSVNGYRRFRLDISYIEDLIKIAAKAGAAFVTDTYTDRERPYNIGERELAALLLKLGYTEYHGLWRQGLNWAEGEAK